MDETEVANTLSVDHGSRAELSGNGNDTKYDYYQRGGILIELYIWQTGSRGADSDDHCHDNYLK